MSTTQTSTLQGVQFLRAIAAILVVCEHAAKMMEFPEHFGASPSTIYHHGNIGVLIFFVISGFIIAIVALNPDISVKLPASEFARRRFARIVPFLWCCVLAYAVVRFAGTGRWDLEPSLRALAIWPVGELRPNVVWSLRHELIFYVVFGLAMLSRRRRAWMLGLWFVSPVLIAPFLPADGPAGAWIAVFFSTNNLYFATGCALGLLYLRQQACLRLSLPGGLAATTVASVAVMVAGTFYTEQSLLHTMVFLLLSTATVWVGINVRPCNSHLARLGQFLGDASYAIYLVHNIFLLTLLKFAAKVHLQGNLFLIHACFVVLATAGGAAVHVWIERPLVRWVTARVERLGGRHALEGVNV